MGDQSWRHWARLIALGGAYCATFLLLWRISFDQWYLPAGLRTACLLLLPMRYWPAIFVGEAAALLYLRAPKAEQYSYQWAYLSPILYIAMFSAVPYYFKKKADRLGGLIHIFPQAAVSIATWGCLCAMGINYVLLGPRQTITAINFLSFTVGNYYGIMMVLLPYLLWVTREQWQKKAASGSNSVVVALLLMVILYMAATIGPAEQSAIQLMPLIFMIVPVFYLTVVHGWHGAAIGIIFVNVAIAFTLPRTNVTGEFDGIILTAQVALATISGGMLVVGAYISNLFEKSAAALASELQALQSLRLQQDEGSKSSRGLLRALFQSSDLRLRENALLIGAARVHLDDYRHDVVKTLKEEEQYERAMEAHIAGMKAARSLDMQRDYLYPLEIETHGLYAALIGPAFLDAWQQRSRVYQVLRGEQRFLSLPLRLSVYRAIICAMESMQDQSPSEYDVRVRSWRRNKRAGATVLVTCKPVLEHGAPSQVARDALGELEARVIAFDGAMRLRSPAKIRFLMSEAATIQEDEEGRKAGPSSFYTPEN